MQKRSTRESVIVRMNADTDSVTAGGCEFDRSTMTKAERNKLRRLIVAWRFPQGNEKEAA